MQVERAGVGMFGADYRSRAKIGWTYSCSCFVSWNRNWWSTPDAYELTGLPSIVPFQVLSLLSQYLNVVKVGFLEELFNATEANIEEIHDWVERDNPHSRARAAKHFSFKKLFPIFSLLALAISLLSLALKVTSMSLPNLPIQMASRLSELSKTKNLLLLRGAIKS